MTTLIGPRIAGEEREKYLTKREMRKTTGEKEALEDMMGGKRAKIDTGKEKESKLQKQLPNKRQHGTVREQPIRPPLP